MIIFMLNYNVTKRSKIKKALEKLDLINNGKTKINKIIK